MNEFAKKIAYIKGLTEGMNVESKSEEGKIISKLIEVLEQAGDEIERLTERLEECEFHIGDMEDDITSLSMAVSDIGNELDGQYESDDEPFEYDHDFDDDDDDDLFDLYDDDDDDLFEIMCPECGEDVVVDFDMLDEDNNIVCPNCHKNIDLEFDIPDDEMDENEGDIPF